MLNALNQTCKKLSCLIHTVSARIIVQERVGGILGRPCRKGDYVRQVCMMLFAMWHLDPGDRIPLTHVLRTRQASSVCAATNALRQSNIVVAMCLYNVVFVYPFALLHCHCRMACFWNVSNTCEVLRRLKCKRKC